MNNLTKFSGLPIAFKYARLIFSNEVGKVVPEKRTPKEIRPYLRNSNAQIKSRASYLMYRGVALKSDDKLFKQTNLRYDITVIYPKRLGSELAKTIGHYHPLKPRTGISYPEIYEVLSGSAYFLFQEIKGDQAPKLYLVLARLGEKVVVPPGYGHITINAGKAPLIIANIYAVNVPPSNYEFFRAHQGAAYYILKPLAQKKAVQKNNHYKAFGKLNLARPKEIRKLNINFKTPLYALFREAPNNFKFLTHPEKFKSLFNPKNLFQLTGRL